MKKINKRTLDWCIELTRLFWSEQNEKKLDEILADRMDTAQSAESGWYPLLNLLDGILAPHGWNHDASNLEIYLVLRLLGWEAVDEEIEESESL